MSFAGVRQQPPPVQRPHPPIVVGGHSEAGFRRAATANGWYGVFLDVEATLTRLRNVVAGRAVTPAWESTGSCSSSAGATLIGRL